LEAGADFIETNTFSGTSIAQTDYAMEHLVSSVCIAYNGKSEVMHQKQQIQCLLAAQKYHLSYVCQKCHTLCREFLIKYFVSLFCHFQLADHCVIVARVFASDVGIVDRCP